MKDLTSLPKFPYNAGKGLKNLENHIRIHFYYDPDTGVITRDDRKNSSGSQDHYGYLVLKIKGQQFKAHRIAWFLYYGTMPSGEIDHINHNRSDNRIENLRCVDRLGNISNITKVPNKDTGIVGVYKDKYTKGLKKVFTTTFNGKRYRFYDLNEAINFRVSHGQRI